MKSFFNMFTLSIFAGICIGIGGYVYLAVGGVIGAILFAFGLLAVVHYGFNLFTGKAGFLKGKELWKLIPILIGNIVGTFAVALLAQLSPLGLTDVAGNIIDAKLSVPYYEMGLLGIGCGIIMTTAVAFAKQNKYLPLLFGVPVFILCGFPHCVADAFYCSVMLIDNNFNGLLEILPTYGAIVVGNFIGCNVFRGQDNYFYQTK